LGEQVVDGYMTTDCEC